MTDSLSDLVAALQRAAYVVPQMLYLAQVKGYGDVSATEQAKADAALLSRLAEAIKEAQLVNEIEFNPWGGTNQRGVFIPWSDK